MHAKSVEKNIIIEKCVSIDNRSPLLNGYNLYFCLTNTTCRNIAHAFFTITAMPT